MQISQDIVYFVCTFYGVGASPGKGHETEITSNTLAFVPLTFSPRLQLISTDLAVYLYTKSHHAYFFQFQRN